MVRTVLQSVVLHFSFLYFTLYSFAEILYFCIVFVERVKLTCKKFKIIFIADQRRFFSEALHTEYHFQLLFICCVPPIRAPCKIVTIVPTFTPLSGYSSLSFFLLSYLLGGILFSRMNEEKKRPGPISLLLAKRPNTNLYDPISNTTFLPHPVYIIIIRRRRPKYHPAFRRRMIIHNNIFRRRGKLTSSGFLLQLYIIYYVCVRASVYTTQLRDNITMRRGRRTVIKTANEKSLVLRSRGNGADAIGASER